MRPDTPGQDRPKQNRVCGFHIENADPMPSFGPDPATEGTKFNLCSLTSS
jgi:hypothetical protein